MNPRCAAAAIERQADRRHEGRLLVFCLASFGLHLILRAVFPVLPRHGSSFPPPPASAPTIEVALTPIARFSPPQPFVAAAAPLLAPARNAARPGSGAVGPRFAGRKTGHGSGAGTSARPVPGPRRVASSRTRRPPGTLRLRQPNRKAALAQPGGGSAAPGVVLGGRGGAPGPLAPPDDLLFSGGGRGGANLPREAAKLGGGGGSVLPGVPTNDAAETVHDLKSGTGPGTGGGAGTAAGGGTGFVNGAGIGARPNRESQNDRATLRTSPNGASVGAAPDPASSTAVGTRPPGGGAGTGSPLPGTGGTGAGYGRGTGNDAGSGSGNSSIPAGGGGSGEDGGGPGGDGGLRGRVFNVPAPAGRDANGRLHAVYVLDCSWSMAEQNKIRKAKTALKKALAELQPGDTFNVIAFCGTTTPFAPAPQPATPANLRAVARFVDRAPMGEGTNLGDALRAAFASDPVTQVWVLSDGIPNVGITDPAELRTLVRDQDRGRAQVITLALGLGENFPGVELLKALASDNNGAFQLVDLRDPPRRR